MTTTPTPDAAPEGEPVDMCPKGCGPLNHVPDSNVVNCNACGFTGGDAEPVAVKPDDITGPNDQPDAEAPSTELAPREPSMGEQALDRATDAALSNPGIPGRDEFLSLAMQARILSLSGAAPKAVKNNPHIAFHVAMVGRDMGISPSAALNLIDIIGDPEKRPDDLQLSISPELMVAQVHRMGLGKVQVLFVDYTRAVAIALRPDGHITRDIEGNVTEIVGEIGRSTFTWEDGVIAELADQRCIDGAHHWVKPGTSGRTYENRCKCRTGWRTYPKRMLGWRAEGFCCADWFPEAGLGLYSAEELGAMVDEAGRPVDPATVELPPGYEIGSGTVSDTADPGAEVAPAADVAVLRSRIGHLPQAEREALVARWQEKHEQGRINVPPATGSLPGLSVKALNIARALVNGAEQLAKSHVPGWKPWEPGDEAPPGEPQEGQEPLGGTDAPEGGQEAQDGAEGAAAPPPEAVPIEGEVDQPTLGDTPAADPYTVAQMDQAIAAVSIMTARALNAALRERGLAVDKVDEQVRRQSLCRALATEAADAERDAAQGGDPDAQ